MIKKRKPLDSAMEAFVFGKEAIEAPSPTATVPPTTLEAAPTPPAPPSAAPPAPETPATAAVPATETPAPKATPVQPKENSLMTKLQVPDKEPTVRFTVDMSESLHRKLPVLAAKTGRKKVDIVRVLLEDGLKEVEG